jgi:hypothetical protein
VGGSFPCGNHRPHYYARVFTPILSFPHQGGRDLLATICADQKFPPPLWGRGRVGGAAARAATTASTTSSRNEPPLVLE